MYVLRVPLVSVRIEPFGFVRRPLLPAALLTRRWEQCGDERVAGNGFVFVQVAEAMDEQLLDVMAVGEVVKAATDADVEAALDLQQRLKQTQIPRVGQRFSMLEDYHAPAQEAVRAWVERMRALESDAQIKAALSTLASDTFAGGAGNLHGRTLNNGGGGSGSGTWAESSPGALVTDGSGQLANTGVGATLPFASDGISPVGDQHASMDLVASTHMGLLARFSSGPNFYLAWNAPASNDALYRNDAGAYTQIAGGPGIPYGNRVGCLAIGTTISRTKNGTIDATTTDATYASGTGGVHSFAGAGGALYDNYTIETDAGTFTGSGGCTAGGGAGAASASFSPPVSQGTGASSAGGAAVAATAELRGNLVVGLRAFWPLDEASGDAVDAHGGLDLTDVNSVSSDTGLIYPLARKSVANLFQRFTHVDHADLRFGNYDWTFQIWVKVTPSLVNGSWFVSKRNGSTDEFIIYEFDSSGTTIGSVIGGTQIVGGVAVDVWQQYIVWYDAAADVFSMSINNGTPATAASVAASTPGDSDFVIGGTDTRGGLPYAINGLMQAAAKWDRVLSADERAALYNGGAGLTYAQMVEALPGTSSATSASTTGGAGAAANATATPPFSSSVTLVASGAASAATGTLLPPVFHGPTTAIAGGARGAAIATFSAPVFSASGTCTAGGAASAASAIFEPSVSVGVGTNVSGGAAGAAVATFVAPVFSGSGSAVAGGGRCAAAAAFSPPTFTGTATCAVGGASVGGAAAFVAPTFSASAACVIGAARVFASAVPPGVVPAVVIALEHSSIRAREFARVRALEGSRP